MTEIHEWIYVSMVDIVYLNLLLNKKILFVIQKVFFFLINQKFYSTKGFFFLFVIQKVTYSNIFIDQIKVPKNK